MQLEILIPASPEWAASKMDLLQSIAAAGFDDRTGLDLLADCAAGKGLVFAVGECGSGLALIRIEQGPRSRLLLLDGFAGHNVLKKAQAIGRDLEVLRQHFGCASVETVSKDPRWRAVAKRLGFEPVSTIYQRRP